MLQAPFQMLGMLVMLSQRAAASAGRIYEVLDERPSVVDGPLAVDISKLTRGCRVQGRRLRLLARLDH